MESKKFDNFVAITCEVSGIETKDSRDGKTYAVAAATATLGQAPVSLRVVALGNVHQILKEGTFTLLGRLGYEEYERRNGEKVSQLVIYPTKIEAAPTDGKARNYASLTLRVGTDPDPRYTESGLFWVRLRASLGMGKDTTTGEYKPSLWMTVKGFTSKDGDESLPARLASLSQGERVTLAGHLAYETYQGRGYLNLIATKVEQAFQDIEEINEDEVPD